LWLNLAGSDGAQDLLELRFSAPGTHLNCDVLHRDSDEGEGNLANGKTDDLNETTDPDSMERASKSLGITNDVDNGVKYKVVLLDESVEFFGLASVISSHLVRGLDADVSDIGDDDGLHANHVFLRSGSR